MSLPTGATVGAYEIRARLGAGGMGIVYRARDARLGRDVALKLLPEGVIDEPERRARFEREAKLLAALNHPNIATLYSFERVGPRRFLVMELVEGTSLAERITSGPLPLSEALPLFIDIAQGLAAAHAKGVIHRDLKPANIHVTPAGRAKVLDFGLAKALEEVEEREEVSSAAGSLAHSPTLSQSALRRGEVLGTAAYMSPEQVRGEVVDNRADIWAFGCCLYEALTGRRAFHAATVAETMAAILQTEPEWEALPSATPDSVRTLLERCLDKELLQRHHDIADVGGELARAYEEVASATEPAGAVAEPARWILLTRGLLGGLVLGALLALGTVYWTGSEGTSPAVREVRRFSINLPSRAPLVSGSTQGTGPLDSALALSPDETFLVYTTFLEGRTRPMMRRLDRFRPQPLAQVTEGAGPFLSPDGRWLGFHDDVALYKLALRHPGGAEPVRLCEASSISSAVWGDRGNIYFTTRRETGVRRLPAAGGTPEGVELVGPRPPHPWRVSDVLPGERALLLTIGESPRDSRLAILFPDRGRLELLDETGALPRFVPTPTGHLVFVRSGRLAAVPFDPGRGAPLGRSVLLDPEIAHGRAGPRLDWTFSSRGTMIYASAGRFTELRVVENWFAELERLVPSAEVGAPR